MGWYAEIPSKIQEILEWMLAEERIKTGSENPGRWRRRIKRNLNFWRIDRFLPFLQEKLEEQQLATSGMIHLYTKRKFRKIIVKFQSVFFGFNAFYSRWRKLVRITFTILQNAKYLSAFQCTWFWRKTRKTTNGIGKIFCFNWLTIEKHKVYEPSGNITQTKVLPEDFQKFTQKILIIKILQYFIWWKFASQLH